MSIYMKAYRRFINYSLYTLRRVLRLKNITIQGIRLDLSPKCISPELRSVFYEGGYESEEIEILKKHLKPSDCVMEIGAGIGFLSTFIAKKIGSHKIIGYEANPHLINVIKQTHSLNKVNPELIIGILSHSDQASIDFFIESHYWSSSVYRRTENAIPVKVKGIDVNRELNEKKPTFLIMDIEGGENELVPLINWRENTIDKVMIELHPHVIGKENASNILSLLLSRFDLNFNATRGNVFLFERNITK